ncbi:hypothetical protein G7Y89_g11071 [Cudoniella acicularis]|uniref:Luciferase domain-containing protein n=1 Tax=Cudoniella acicularis TaxID=354080 RepID=A0A8H4RCL6_9HELO|nr:hypothetical protein G7Y89_g11071 [Cudoniella acicularis]
MNGPRLPMLLFRGISLVIFFNYVSALSGLTLSPILPYDDPKEIVKCGKDIGRKSFLPSTLSKREGERLTLAKWMAPHRQVSQLTGEDMHKLLGDAIDEIVVKYSSSALVKTSVLEKEGDALFIADQIPTPHSIAKATKREIAHVHTDIGSGDYSLHLCLSPADCKEVILKQWGERLSLAGSLMPHEYLIIYTPRTVEEVAVVKEIVEAAVLSMTGSPDSSKKRPSWSSLEMARAFLFRFLHERTLHPSPTYSLMLIARLLISPQASTSLTAFLSSTSTQIEKHTMPSKIDDKPKKRSQKSSKSTPADSYSYPQQSSIITSDYHEKPPVIGSRTQNAKKKSGIKSPPPQLPSEDEDGDYRPRRTKSTTNRRAKKRSAKRTRKSARFEEDEKDAWVDTDEDVEDLSMEKDENGLAHQPPSRISAARTSVREPLCQCEDDGSLQSASNRAIRPNIAKSSPAGLPSQNKNGLLFQVQISDRRALRSKTKIPYLPLQSAIDCQKYFNSFINAYEGHNKSLLKIDSPDLTKYKLDQPVACIIFVSTSKATELLMLPSLSTFNDKNGEGWEYKIRLFSQNPAMELHFKAKNYERDEKSGKASFRDSGQWRFELSAEQMVEDLKRVIIKKATPDSFRSTLLKYRLPQITTDDFRLRNLLDDLKSSRMDEAVQCIVIKIAKGTLWLKPHVNISINRGEKMRTLLTRVIPDLKHLIIV